MEFICLDFGDDLNEAAYAAITEKSILIFPTRASAEAARIDYQSHWTLQDLLWISMEDFKNMLLCMEHPVLEDDKRLLCLYQVMTEEEREHFHLSSFADLIAWGTQLFQFCQELCEAGIPVLRLQEHVDDAKLNLRLWQEENLAKISQILSRYYHFITDLGFADRVFHEGANAALMPFQAYRMISVNQFYHSALEQALLKKCELAGNQIVLIYHGLEVDSDAWEAKPLQLSNAWQKLPHKPQIKLFKCDDERQAVLSFLALEQLPGAIVDSQFTTKDYAAYFDPAKLRLPQFLPISDTSWYRLQRVLLEILQSLQESPGFIPLRIIIKYFNTLQMLLPFCPDWQKQDFIAFEQELYSLNSKGFLYLDLQPQHQFAKEETKLYQFCAALTDLLKQIMQLQSIKDLAHLQEAGLHIERFSTSVELTNTDLLPQVWTALANFSATESMGLLSSWSDIFAVPYLGIFELWLDYLKSIKLKRIFAQEPSAIWELTNLLDSRNRSFERLAVFNLVEGVLPQSPSPIWLLNEHQRKVLGLKTYDDIRDWDRYYFFRLVFCAHEVSLFTYLDTENAIEYSSLIGELQGFAELDEMFCRVDEKGVLQAWQRQMQHVHNLDLSLADYGSPVSADFFRLPSEPQRDFGGSRDIHCSSYNLQLFAYNPFVWYIRGLRNLNPRQIVRRELISPSLFGTLLHAYFASVLGVQASKHNDLQSLDADFTDTAALRNSLLGLINSPTFKYKMPKNYNADYLSSILCERLAESLKEFYLRFLRKRWSNVPFTLIPEQDTMSDEERKRKVLTQHTWQQETYRVLIRGKADLRIESGDSKCIVDFKTGGANAEQLMFYEWLYYLLEGPELEPEVQSFFWMILDMRISDKAQTNAKKRNAYLENISAALATALEHGYLISRKSADRKIMCELSRSDLYLPGVHNARL